MKQTMNMNTNVAKIVSGLFALTAACFATNARAAGDVIKIGYITDLSGIYADIDGPGGVRIIPMQQSFDQ